MEYRSNEFNEFQNSNTPPLHYSMKKNGLKVLREENPELRLNHLNFEYTNKKTKFQGSCSYKSAVFEKLFRDLKYLLDRIIPLPF